MMHHLVQFTLYNGNTIIALDDDGELYYSMIKHPMKDQWSLDWENIERLDWKKLNVGVAE